jgi:hypothetical protein
MSFVASAIFRFIVLTLLVAPLVACDWIYQASEWATGDDSSQQRNSDSGEIRKVYEQGPDKSRQAVDPNMPLETEDLRVEFEGLRKIKGALVRDRFQATDLDELAWSIASCQCSPRWAHKVLSRTLEANGPLPQVMVPQVREAILRDKRIQAVVNLPGGPEGVISRLFTSDQQLDSQIRSNLLATIQMAWQNPLKIGSSQSLNFDAFTPFPWRVPAAQGGRVVRPDGFDVGSLALRWLLVANAEAPWTTGPGRVRPDLPLEQDIHLVSWARMMAEINYLLGLKRGFDGRIYGGLMINPRDNSGGLLGFEMLPETGAPMLAMSGQMRVAYQPVSAIKLIINGNEKWARLPGTIDLQEQTRIWRAGAAIFKGLRNESRKYPAALFGVSDVNLFPPDAQRLGLAFLQGMQVLLGEELIAFDVLTIGDNFSIPEQRVQRSETDISSMVRVAAAAAAWVQELQSIESSGLKEDDKVLLRSGLPKLQDALRLSVLRGIRRSLDWGAFEGAGKGLPLARQAELIATFAAIEQDIMRSGYVRRKMAAFTHRMLENISVRVNSASYVEFSPEEAIWIKSALSRIRLYSSNEAEVSALIQSIEAGIRAWDSSVAI